MNVRRSILTLAFFGLLFCFHSGISKQGVKTMAINLTSNAFTHNGAIPKEFTCDGADISPHLSWSNLPENTKSLVLIVDDPDAPDPAAPKLTWVHWLLYNIPPDTNELPENQTRAALPKGALAGMNGWRKAEYRGPCPPVGRHPYFFKLYALDSMLPDLDSPDKAQLEQAMATHIIGQGELIGTYQH